jgi:hypothetical protein
MKGVWACCKAEGSEDERSQGLLQARIRQGVKGGRAYCKKEGKWRLFCWESNLAISFSSVKNNNVQFLLGVLLLCETLKKFSSSAPGLSMMTLRECHVDCPFPDHGIR